MGKHPTIKYICISDLHLGEEDSLLTNLKPGEDVVDCSKPSPVLRLLGRCIKDILKDQEEPPTLIILGDGLELALSTTNVSVMAFERFLDVMLGEGICKDIIYIPGNHDHHIWEVARETQYSDYVKRKMPWGKELPEPWHHTRMIKTKPHHLTRSKLIDSVISRKEKIEDFKVEIAYPNFCLVNEDGSKAVCFHHGHLVESLYVLMSIAKSFFSKSKDPLSIERILERIYRNMTIDEIEGENFAWIDFFWSSMGRQGGAGEEVEKVYERLQTEESFEEMADTVAENISKAFDIPYVPGDLLEKGVIKKALMYIFGKLHKQERGNTDATLTSETSKTLLDYISGPLRKQFEEELGVNGLKEVDLTFVFGHTHKPFSRPEAITPWDEEQKVSFKNWVKIYNTGGWIVDKTPLSSVYGGDLVIVDEELNVVALRMFKQGDKSLPHFAEVESSDKGRSGLYRYLYDEYVSSGRIQKDPWAEFVHVAQNASEVRAAHMRKRILGRKANPSSTDGSVSDVYGEGGF